MAEHDRLEVVCKHCSHEFEHSISRGTMYLTTSYTADTTQYRTEWGTANVRVDQYGMEAEDWDYDDYETNDSETQDMKIQCPSCEETLDLDDLLFLVWDETDYIPDWGSSELHERWGYESSQLTSIYDWDGRYVAQSVSYEEFIAVEKGERTFNFDGGRVHSTGPTLLDAEEAMALLQSDPEPVVAEFSESSDRDWFAELGVASGSGTGN